MTKTAHAAARAASLALALVLAACGAEPTTFSGDVRIVDDFPPVETITHPDPYVSAIPAPGALAIDFDVAIPAATRAGALSADFVAALSNPEEMTGARTGAAGMDAALALVTRLVPPAGSPLREVRAGVRAVGPAIRCVVPTLDAECPAGAEVESELVVREGEAGLFAWTIRVRGVGAGDDGWFNVFFGRVAPGEVDGSKQGDFVLSLDALRQIAWALPGAGRLLGGFTLRPDCKAFMYRAEALTLEGSPELTGRLFVQRCASGDLRVRFTSAQDVLPGPGGSELVTDHVGMTSNGGVAYSLIANWNPAFGYRGDVAWNEWPGEAFVLVRSCFGADRRPIQREAFTCRTDASIADCLTNEPVSLAGFEGGSWDSCPALAPSAATAVPASATLSLRDESPEAGFLAPPRPPAYPEELESVLGI